MQESTSEQKQSIHRLIREENKYKVFPYVDLLRNITHSETTGTGRNIETKVELSCGHRSFTCGRLKDQQTRFWCPQCAKPLLFENNSDEREIYLEALSSKWLIIEELCYAVLALRFELPQPLSCEQGCLARFLETHSKNWVDRLRAEKLVVHKGFPHGRSWRNCYRTVASLQPHPHAPQDELSTMAEWEAFEACMDLGARNCYEVKRDVKSGSYCTALHEDPENLPYDHSTPHFGREIYEHTIYFNIHPDHLEFQDGLVLLLPPEEDGWRELCRADRPGQPAGIYWTRTADENKETFFIEER